MRRLTRHSKKIIIEQNSTPTDKAGSSNWSTPGPVRANVRLKVGQFLLKILMWNHFSPYIRWTGNGLEFQIVNGRVVFTEWRMHTIERQDLTTNGDPGKRWRDNLITSELAKNNLKGIKEFKIDGTPLIKKRHGMKGGHYFTNTEYVCNFLGITLDQLLLHITTVTEGYSYPEMQSSTTSNNTTTADQSYFQLVHNPYAPLTSLEPIPHNSSSTDPLNYPCQPTSTNQHTVALTRPSFEGSYFPNQAFPSLYTPKPDYKEHLNYNIHEPSTSQTWPATNESHETITFSPQVYQGYTNFDYRDPTSVISHIPCNSAPSTAFFSAPTSLMDPETQEYEEIELIATNLSGTLQPLEPCMAGLIAIEGERTNPTDLSDEAAIALGLLMQEDFPHTDSEFP